MDQHHARCIVLRRGLEASASATYMAVVIAFFFAGRFSCTLRMLPDRSVRISFIVHLRPLLSRGATLAGSCRRAEALDLLRVETELLEDLVVVLSEIRTPFRRYFGDACTWIGTADRGVTLPPAPSMERRSRSVAAADR